jgi:HK97 family phage portal protein
LALPSSNIIKVSSDHVDPATLDGNGTAGPGSIPQIFTIEGMRNVDPMTLMGGGNTIINEHTALSIPAYLSGVRFIAETLAGLPKCVYQRTNGTPTHKEDHPAEWTLNKEPNALQSPFKFWSTFMLHAVNWSNAYAAIRRIGDETTLYNLAPDRMIPFRFKGQQWYAFDTEQLVDAHDPNSRYIIFADSEMLHLSALSFDGMAGMKTVQMTGETLRTAKNTEAHISRYYKQGGLLGGVIETDQKLTPEQRKEISDAIRNEYSGVENSNKWMIITHGGKARTLTPALDTTQTDLNRKYSTLEICRILRLPPHILYELGRATWANIESMGIELVKYSLTNWTTPLEQEMDRKLLTRPERKSGFYIKCNFAALLRGDHAAQIDAATKRTQNGLTTPDEERAVWDLPPFADGIGSKPRVAANTVELGKETPAPAAPAAPADPEKDPDADDAAAEDENLAARVIADAAERVGRKTAKATETAFKKFEANPAGLTIWGNTFSEEQRVYASNAAAVLLPGDKAAAVGSAYAHELRAFYAAHNRGDTAATPDLAAIINRLRS